MSEGDVLIQDASGKESSKPTTKVDMTNQGLDATPCNRASKKQKAKVGSANSQNDNTIDQGSDDAPQKKTSKKQDVVA
ncbi:hypothetical protein FXO38_21391 [Capsicum annuum]|uniref:Uncharacterized protein n=1 Tax=Capsicum annuum TaxID=4072 RepID=A0A2G2Y9A9_CAPAN|nr:hypothetical protein FXO38_21391 [Capsicum annuum]KAF3685435.1 hypothetical protein FXO37_00626 [Capsicum annuum]PHT66345.1 hypothetical protein T459_30770 [Capsicum annuum]